MAEYVDIGISDTKERRPALDWLMAYAHKRKFDVVVVWKFDSFARSVSHMLGAGTVVLEPKMRRCDQYPGARVLPSRGS